MNTSNAYDTQKNTNTVPAVWVQYSGFRFGPQLAPRAVFWLIITMAVISLKKGKKKKGGDPIFVSVPKNPQGSLSGYKNIEL